GGRAAHGREDVAAASDRGSCPSPAGGGSYRRGDSDRRSVRPDPVRYAAEADELLGPDAVGVLIGGATTPGRHHQGGARSRPAGPRRGSLGLSVSSDSGVAAPAF